MTPTTSLPRDTSLDDRLAELVAALRQPLPWVEAWQRLEERSTAEERLEVYRAICAAASLPAEAGFCLIAWHLGNVALERPSATMRRLLEELAAIEECYIVEDGAAFRLGQWSEEFWDTDRCLVKADDTHYVATLAAFGEHEMARLY